MNPKLSQDSANSQASSSREDTNANLNNSLNQAQSKGAIPKTKNFTRIPQCNGKGKSLKVNNNVETFQKNDDPFKILHNGVAKSVNNYISINSISSEDLNFDGNPSKIAQFESCSSTDFHPKTTDFDEFNDSSSSNEDDNELSISDDGCIYTYKGDNVADLPSSFYHIEPPVFEQVEAEIQRASPEMDFLEMDFDPGPSGDADDSIVSSQSSNEDEIINLPLDNDSPTFPCEENRVSSTENDQAEPEIDLVQEMLLESNTIDQNNARKELEKILPWHCSTRTKGSKRLRAGRKHMSSFGDLTPTSCTFEVTQNVEDGEKRMIWSQQEAELKQITQIGPSSCGATAVLNVLTALRLPLPTLDAIQEFVHTNLRQNSAPLPEYLRSRSKAGCTHREIIRGLDKASGGRIYARFFAMYPERELNLNKWLSFWIENGCVPVATLNLQKCEGAIPDSWHHQMIFGVDSTNVYLTNSLEVVESAALWHQLCSESVLLVRRDDVLSRWNPRSDIVELGKIRDKRWTRLNVLGQVAKIVREQPRKSRENSTVTSHIKIPADYKSGITIAVEKSSTLVYQLLRECPELPLLKPTADESAAANCNITR